MSKPQFSIVIPTRQRHETLGSAIRSVLLQPFENFELIVMDNASSDETWQVVRQFQSPRLKYDRAPAVLPMNENWERGLRQCAGEYVFFLGDDDAIMPDGMTIASQILARMPLDVLAWNKYTYWWDNAISEFHRGRLFVHFNHEFQNLDGLNLLDGYYQWRVGFGSLPGIYSAFVNRKLIQAVSDKAGGYYFAAGSPDVYSGVANAYFGKHIGMFQRGLSLCGNSGYSTGCSHFFRSKGAVRREAYYTDEGKTVGQLLHPSLIPTVNLEMNLADAQLRAKENLFPNDARFEFDVRAMLNAMAGGINRDPASYDETLADIRNLAAKFSIDPASIGVPPRAAASGTVLQGLLQDTPNSPVTIAVNGIEAGVRDSAEAARLAHSLLPTITIQ